MRKSCSIFCFALRILFASVKVIRSFHCHTFLSTLNQPITSPLQDPAPTQYRPTIFQSLPSHNSTRPIATILIQNMRTYSVLPNTPRVLRECSESTPEYSGVLREYSGVLRRVTLKQLFDSFQYCGGSGVSPNFFVYLAKNPPIEENSCGSEYSGVLREYSGVLREYSGVLPEHSGVLRTTRILRLFDSFQYCGGGGVSPNFLYYPVKTRR